MKQILIALLFVVAFLPANSQLTKNTWLVGGNGKFYTYNYKTTFASSVNVIRQTQIDISPSASFFIIDKLALGIRPTVSLTFGKDISPNAGSINVKRYLIGPYGRYYFLNAEKQYNIVTDIAYQFGLFNVLGGRGDLRTFSALAGPVIYFNTSVGIEFLVGYSYSKEDVRAEGKTVNKGFQMGLGFQIHLGK